MICKNYYAQETPEHKYVVLQELIDSINGKVMSTQDVYDRTYDKKGAETLAELMNEEAHVCGDHIVDHYVVYVKPEEA